MARTGWLIVPLPRGINSGKNLRLLRTFTGMDVSIETKVARLEAIVDELPCESRDKRLRAVEIGMATLSAQVRNSALWGSLIGGGVVMVVGGLLLVVFKRTLLGVP